MFSFLFLPKPALRPQARSASLIPHVFSQVLVLSLLLVLTLSLLAAHPAAAQDPSGWYPVPCDANGKPLSSPSQDAQQFYLMNGTEDWTLTNTYPADLIAAAKDNPSAYAKYLQAFVPYDQPDSMLGFPVFAGLGSAANGSNHTFLVGASNIDYLYGGGDWYYSVNTDGASSTGLINGAVSADLSGQLVFYFKMSRSPFASSDPTTPPPDHINLLLKSQVGAYASISLDPGAQTTTGVWAQATASDGLPFGETATAGAGVDDHGLPVGSVGPSLVRGYHLVRAAVDPVTRIATVFLNGSTHWVAGATLPYGVLTSPYPEYPWYVSGQQTNGPASARANGYIEAGVKQDNREASLIPLGHVPTKHKEVSFDPTTQTFVAKGVPNVETGDTLQVDTGLPIAVIGGPAEAPRVTYPIDYQGGISLFPVLGDSYTITASLNGGSDGGTEPIRQTMGLGGWYAIDPFRVNYTAPLITYPALPYTDSDGANYDYSKPQLSPGDTGKIDGIEFNYTFQSDRAIAHKRLSVHLHMPTEWSQIGNPQGDEDTSQPYTDVESTPASADGGQPLNVERKPIDNTIAFAYQGASGAFNTLAALSGENPPLAAFLAVTGYAIDKAAPDNISPTVSDDTSDFASAIEVTKQSTNPNFVLFDKPEWLDTWDTNDQRTSVQEEAQCTWKLVQTAPIRTFHWLGDQYGAFGYTGQVKTDVTQVEKIAYYHFYITPVIVSEPPPVNR